MKTLDAIKKPLSIAMWDSSWLRRRYRGGGFEDWDKALDGLVERGYNAVRIDVYPHLIASAPDGSDQETFKDIPDHAPNFYGFGMWGSQWTNYISPRKALPEFIRKCGSHKVKVGLATWMKPTAEKRNELLEGAADIVRVWDETLRFLEKENCLDNVLYVDMLNELPNGYCMRWIHDSLSMLRNPPPKDFPVNSKQAAFLRSFVSEAVEGLKEKWPQISIACSLVHGRRTEEYLDLSVMDFIDSHTWISLCREFNKDLNYWETIGRHGHPEYLFTKTTENTGGYGTPGVRYIPQDSDYDKIYSAILERWRSGRPEWEAWLKAAVESASALAKKLRVPVGNTEGWGMVMWAEHPLLGWEINHDAGEICARLGAENGWLFNCSSNFCHPHHYGSWEDIEWHRKVTKTIKSGKTEKR